MSGYIQVSGRVVDYYTKLPLNAKLELKCDDATSGKNSGDATISLCTGVTNADGTFSLKSLPSLKTHYYLYIDGRSFNDLTQNAQIFNAKENQNNDLGDILWGSHTFYCTITIVPTTTSCVVVNNHSFSSGTSTQFVDNLVYSYGAYESWAHNYLINYKTNNCVNTGYWDYSYFNMSVPITSLTGPLTATISY